MDKERSSYDVSGRVLKLSDLSLQQILPTAERTFRPETILVVDDDPGVAELQHRTLKRAGFRALVAHTTEEAYQQIANAPIDLILLDYQLSGNSNGIELCKHLSQKNGRLPPVILVTGFGSEDVLTDAIRLGIRDFIPKSGEYLEQIPGSVRALLDKVQVEQRLEITEARLVAMVQASQDAILLVELNGQISFANLAAEHMFGMPLQQLVGQSVDTLLTVDLAGEESSPASWMQSLQQSESKLLRRETKICRSESDIIPVEVSISRVDAGEKHFFSFNFRDLTERSQLEQELQQAREHEQQAREMSLILDLASGSGVAVTASVMGVRAVRDAYPNIYDGLKASYADLLEEGLNRKIFKVNDDVQGHCQMLAGRLGFLKAGPRDVIEIHTDVLKSKMAPPTVPRKAKAYLEEGRIRVLELMGFLALYYRSRPWPDNSTTSKVDGNQPS